MSRNRHTDAVPQPKKPPALPPLPVIDWSKVGGAAPRVIDLGKPGPTEALPEADVVVMTWTTNEWNALDHVFVSSDHEASSESDDFKDGWIWRAADDAPKGTFGLWGYYRVVEIDRPQAKPVRVLLWKCDAHLAYTPWAQGVIEMVQLVINESKPKRLYTIGTAGGATVNEKLGDTAITNAGVIELKASENLKTKLNGVSVQCESWFPSQAMNDSLQEHLLFRLSDVVTPEYLDYLLWTAIHDPKDGDPSWQGEFTVADLSNAALEDLTNPLGLDKHGVPLLTTDYYFISDGNNSEQYSALEMDDAVVGHAAGELDVDYVFVRNISDPVVPTKTPVGKTIPTNLRVGWSGQIYQNYGFYSSMNGALLTWGMITSDTDV